MVKWECPTNPREASGLDPEAVHLLLATLLGYGFIADGVASGDPSGGVGLSLLVVLAATLGLPLLWATQVGAVVAGTAGAFLGTTTTPVSER